MNKDFLKDVVVEPAFINHLFFADSLPIKCFPNTKDDSLLLTGKVLEFALAENEVTHINPNADVLNEMLNFFRAFLPKYNFTEQELIVFVQYLKNEICKQYTKNMGDSFSVDYYTKDFSLLKDTLKRNKGTAFEKISYAVFGIGKIAQFVITYYNAYHNKYQYFQQNPRWHQINNHFLEGYNDIKNIVQNDEIISIDIQQSMHEDQYYESMKQYQGIMIFEPFFEATCALMQLQKYALKKINTRMKKSEEHSAVMHGRNGAKYSNEPYEKIHEEIYKLYLVHIANHTNRTKLAEAIHQDLTKISNLFVRTNKEGKVTSTLNYEEDTVYKKLDKKNLQKFQAAYGHKYGKLPNIASRGAGKNRKK